MRLHQLKLDFIPEQDRLLLRVSTDNQLEMRLWLTRRALRLLWPLLLKIVRSSPEIALQSNPQARDALVGMQHERALRQANFANPFEETPRELPLGPEPILVTRIRTNKDDGGNLVGSQESAPRYLAAPGGAPGAGLDLSWRPGARKAPTPVLDVADLPDSGLDFEGRSRGGGDVGAYAAGAPRPVWPLQLARKPAFLAGQAEAGPKALLKGRATAR